MLNRVHRDMAYLYAIHHGGICGPCAVFIAAFTRAKAAEEDLHIFYMRQNVDGGKLSEAICALAELDTHTHTHS